jgi:hypothetical protein
MAITIFELDIERSVDLKALGWPERGAARAEGFGGNRNYGDLRGCSWEEAQRILEIEQAILARLESATDFADVLDRVNKELDELYDEGDSVLFGLDIGVASTVISLSAARCIPFSSCNGGSFGEHHHESFPLVTFFAKPEWIPAITDAAEEANAGLCNSGEALAVYAQIKDMLALARGLMARRALFRNLRSRTSDLHSGPQVSLPFP